MMIVFVPQWVSEFASLGLVGPQNNFTPFWWHCVKVTVFVLGRREKRKSKWLAFPYLYDF